MPIAVEQRLTKVGSSVVEMFELPLYCSMRRNCYRTLTVLETILELVKEARFEWKSTLPTPNQLVSSFVRDITNHFAL